MSMAIGRWSAGRVDMAVWFIGREMDDVVMLYERVRVDSVSNGPET